jgi:hypothetical protein
MRNSPFILSAMGLLAWSGLEAAEGASGIVTMYDPDTGALELSNGEQYVVDEDAAAKSEIMELREGQTVIIPNDEDGGQKTVTSLEIQGGSSGN